jgi:hypothetical protein
MNYLPQVWSTAPQLFAEAVGAKHAMFSTDRSLINGQVVARLRAPTDARWRERSR